MSHGVVYFYLHSFNVIVNLNMLQQWKSLGNWDLALNVKNSNKIYRYLCYALSLSIKGWYCPLHLHLKRAIVVRDLQQHRHHLHICHIHQYWPIKLHHLWEKTPFSLDIVKMGVNTKTSDRVVSDVTKSTEKLKNTYRPNAFRFFTA